MVAWKTVLVPSIGFPVTIIKVVDIAIGGVISILTVEAEEFEVEPIPFE